MRHVLFVFGADVFDGIEPLARVRALQSNRNGEYEAKPTWAP
jgi:hypothetical protein